MRLMSVQVGRVAPMGPASVPTGFVKRPVAGRVAVSLTGLAGDEQADHSVHGDAAKAVYGYAVESYAVWRRSHPQHLALWAPGGVGENLTTEGFHEGVVCIGDILRIGGAVLQVTQPREPCFKFALRFGDSGLPKAMVRNGRSGWYYRVLQAGGVEAGDAVDLLDRINPEWSVTRMNATIHAREPDRGALLELAALAGLAETWPRRLAKRLAPGG